MRRSSTFLAITSTTTCTAKRSQGRTSSIHFTPARRKRRLIPTDDRFNVDGKFVALYGRNIPRWRRESRQRLQRAAVIDVPNEKFDRLPRMDGQNRDPAATWPCCSSITPGLDMRIKAIRQYGRDDFGDDAHWLTSMGAGPV